MPSYDVVGVGNALVDILAPTPDALLADIGLPKGSMTLVEEDQSTALYARLGVAKEQSGGSAANTIAGLGALGAKTAFIGMVKDDDFGRVFRHDLSAVGAEFRGVAPTNGPATGRCLVMVSPDAERTMATYLGAGVNLGPDDVDEAFVAQCRIAYMEGYLFDKPPAKAAFRKVAAAVRAAGGQAAITLSDSFCVERHREDFLTLARDGLLDIVFANEAEICALYQYDDVEAAAARLAEDTPMVVVTRSEKGAMALNAAGDAADQGVEVERAAVPADPVAAVVDTTGAGDLFAAGFLFGCAQDAPLARRLEMGCLSAAQTIQQIGPRPDGLAEAFRARGFIG